MLQTSSELRTAGFTAVAWQPHVHTAPHGVLAGKCQTEKKVRSRALSWLIKRLITLSVLYQVSNELSHHMTSSLDWVGTPVVKLIFLFLVSILWWNFVFVWFVFSVFFFSFLLSNNFSCDYFHSNTCIVVLAHWCFFKATHLHSASDKLAISHLISW